MDERLLFASALNLAQPWYVSGTRFDAQARSLTILIDFTAGSRFAHPAASGQHPVHDTQIKRFRHLNFFEHECFLEVRVPPDDRGRVIGRGGRTAKALRTLVSALADGTRVRVDVADH